MEKGGEPFTLLQTIATDPQSSPSQHGLSGTTYGSAIIPRPEPLSRRVLDEHVLFPPGMVQVCLQEPDRLFLIFRLLRGVNIHGRWGIHRSVHYHDLRCHLALARRLCRWRGPPRVEPRPVATVFFFLPATWVAAQLPTAPMRCSASKSLFLQAGQLAKGGEMPGAATSVTGPRSVHRVRAARGPALYSDSIARASAAGVALVHSPIQR